MHFFVKEVCVGHLSPRLVGIDIEVGFRGIRRKAWIEVHLQDLVPHFAETLLHDSFEAAPAVDRWTWKKPS
jgi:hypothetical protein